MAIITAGIVFLILFLIIFIQIHQRKMLAKDAKIMEKERNFNKALLDATLEIAEEERSKIARNVHDDLGMMLHVLKNNISRAKRNASNKMVVEEALNESNQVIEQTIHTSRMIAGDLLPAPLVNFGFIPAMHYLKDQVNASKLLEVEIKTSLTEVNLEKRNTIHLFRLVKEVINNIIKHAHATFTEINIFTSGKVLNIVISHNGNGITTEKINKLSQSGKGVGLRSIMGRAQLIGATVQYIIVDAETSKTIIEIPLP